MGQRVYDYPARHESVKGFPIIWNISSCVSGVEFRV